MNAISSRRQSFARSRAWISLFTSLALVAATWAALGSGRASAATTTTVVGPSDLAPNGPWALEPSSNTGSFSFVTGPGTPPSGVGSLRLTIASGQHEWLNNYAYGACATGPSCNTPLTSRATITSMDTLTYRTYRASGSVLPTLNIETDWSGSGSSYTTFVFVPNLGAAVNNTWQTWDATNPAHGTWYSTSNTGAGTPFNCAFQSAGCDHTWAEIQSGYPLARVRYGLGPNVGTGGTFDGNVDNLTVEASGNTTIYNFDPETVPSAPQMVTAKAGNGKATVHWNPPANNGGLPIADYLVTPIKAGVAQPVQTFNASTTTRVITGLTNGVNYKFVVAARNNVGTGPGANSNGGVRVGAPGTPPQPTVSKPASGSLKVAFKAPAPNGSKITGFTAKCTSGNGGAAASKNGGKSPITVTGLTAGKQYRCRVLARNARGDGSPSLPSAPITA